MLEKRICDMLHECEGSSSIAQTWASTAILGVLGYLPREDPRPCGEQAVCIIPLETISVSSVHYL